MSVKVRQFLIRIRSPQGNALKHALNVRIERCVRVVHFILVLLVVSIVLIGMFICRIEVHAVYELIDQI